MTNDNKLFLLFGCDSATTDSLSGTLRVCVCMCEYVCVGGYMCVRLYPCMYVHDGYVWGYMYVYIGICPCVYE